MLTPAAGRWSPQRVRVLDGRPRYMQDAHTGGANHQSGCRQLGVTARREGWTGRHEFGVLWASGSLSRGRRAFIRFE